MHGAVLEFLDDLFALFEFDDALLDESVGDGVALVAGVPSDGFGAQGEHSGVILLQTICELGSLLEMMLHLPTFEGYEC